MAHSEEKKHSVSGYRYLLYKPENYSAQEKNWPALIFLHGAGERGSDLEKLKRHGPPKLLAQDVNLPFVVIAPQCPSNQYWEPESLKMLTEEIMQFPHIDKTRICLTGISMGGYGTWMLATRYPDLFAAALPICGGGNPSEAHRMKQVPTWVFHGAKDDIVPLSESEVMVQALKKAGGNVKFTIYPDAGHDSWTQTYNNKDIYNWFLDQQKV